jgi:hypothetical protein
MSVNTTTLLGVSTAPERGPFRLSRHTPGAAARLELRIACRPRTLRAAAGRIRIACSPPAKSGTKIGSSPQFGVAPRAKTNAARRLRKRCSSAEHSEIARAGHFLTRRLVS